MPSRNSTSRALVAGRNHYLSRSCVVFARWVISGRRATAFFLGTLFMPITLQMAVETRPADSQNLCGPTGDSPGNSSSTTRWMCNLRRQPFRTAARRSSPATFLLGHRVVSMWNYAVRPSLPRACLKTAMPAMTQPTSSLALSGGESPC